jgi:hypothetical protein
MHRTCIILSPDLDATVSANNRRGAPREYVLPDEDPRVSRLWGHRR